MKKPFIFAIVVAAFLLGAGCVQPPVSVGCCLKANVINQHICVLYNTTTFTNSPLQVHTVSCSSDNANCSITNIIDPKQPDIIVPTCTQDSIKACIAPNCLTMICGDFKFNPHVAPGVTDSETSSSGIQADIPSGLSDTSSVAFYKAQCRFLPMDARLAGIMKTTASQINTFRIGVGGSFDEFDKYRNYFPISDQFCSINPPQQAGQLRVDRFMNYLQPNSNDQSTAIAYNPFDPTSGITNNCIPYNYHPHLPPPPPLSFSDSSGSHTTQNPPQPPITYDSPIPDNFGYKFATYAREEYAVSKSDFGFVTATPFFNTSSVYKTIDNAFYRKWLSIDYANQIYGKNQDPNKPTTTRAQFECDVSANECYSGNCDTKAYGRSVMLTYNPDPLLQQEVVTDCNAAVDNSGAQTVVCAPTTSVQTNTGAAPTRAYAPASISGVHLELYEDYNPIGGDSGGGGRRHVGYPLPIIPTDYALSGLLVPDKPLSARDVIWSYFGHVSDSRYFDLTGTSMTISQLAGPISTPYSLSSIFTYEGQKDCTGQGSNNKQWCPNLQADSNNNPPVSGAVFVGKPNGQALSMSEFGDPNTAVIGYAIATPDQFANMMVVKNCGVATSVPIYAVPPGTEFACANVCPTATNQQCVKFLDQINKNPDDRSNPPCKEANAIVGYTNSGSSPYYAQVQVPDPTFTPQIVAGNPGSIFSWQPLINTFAPLVQSSMNSLHSGTDSSCGPNVNTFDIAFESMPWVVNFEKGYYQPNQVPTSFYFLSSSVGQAIRNRNIYDELMASALGTTDCNLRRTASSPPGWDYISYYNVAYSQFIYLLTYKPGSGKWGNCAVDDATYLPQVKTFGWCGACTQSTLAYQQLTKASNDTNPGHYLPYQSMRVDGPTATNKETICDWNPSQADTISCFNSHIIDIGDYHFGSGGDGQYVYAGTNPEASVIKERLGNYLKSGVMPVFDLSDGSNWYDNYTPQFCFTPQCVVHVPSANLDFKPLFGKEGASVVIVDHVPDGSVDQTKIQEIINRTMLVRENCFGCLTAFHVDSPASAKSFNDTVNFVLSNPLAAFSVDLVTFDYSVSPTAVGDPNYTASDLVNYSSAVLQSKNKPTMVVGFASTDFFNFGAFGSDDYAKIFAPLATNQSDFVKAGLIGLVYAPARTAPPGSGGDTTKGIVIVDQNNIGSVNQEFCALQATLQKATGKSPVDIFAKVDPVNNVTCVSCTSLDKAEGLCNQPDAQMCNDNIPCTVPTGLSPNDAKCPANSVIDNSTVGNLRCPVCSNLPGNPNSNYICTLTHANGTIETRTGKMRDVTSAGYVDVIAGLSGQDKCCLEQSPGGPRYTFIKNAYETPVSKPIVFSKTGDPGVDCGLGASIGDVNTLSSFCGNQQVPIRDFDINCTIK